MGYYLGIDTSNYTTSVAIYNSFDNSILSEKKLLPVKQGQLGLRQSDAVFEHTKQFFDIYKRLPQDSLDMLDAIGVSVKPSEAKDSYMPCFLVGKNIAECIAHSKNIPVNFFSHQVGHIAAALYSSNKIELFNKRFIAFHISGGTTDMLLVEPNDETVFLCTLIGRSTDLKFGQAVDRLGKLLDMPFPSGMYLDELALKGNNTLKFPTSVKDGNCSVSGFENKFVDFLQKGISSEDIACSFFNSVADIIIKMSEFAREKQGDLSIIFSGGVMSNTIIRNKVTSSLHDVYFCEPRFSSDNAAGIAILGYLKSVGEI